jgi:hypothetical protein
LRKNIRQLIRDLCKWKGVEIIEGNIMPNHMHILVSIPQYIQEQDEQDQSENGLSKKEFVAPFKGSE